MGVVDFRKLKTLETDNTCLIGAVSRTRTRLQQLQTSPALSSQQLPLFKKSSVAVGFESLAAVDVAVEVEMIVQ